MTEQRLTVSIADAAEMLGVSEQTISRMIKTKKLAAAKIHRRMLIKLASIGAEFGLSPNARLRLSGITRRLRRASSMRTNDELLSRHYPSR